LIRDDDAIIFFNFRRGPRAADDLRPGGTGLRQVWDAKRPKNLFYVAMTQYDKNWPWLKYVIAPEKLEHILAQVFAELQYKNLRTAGNRKIRARHLFFQWRSGEAVRRRRANSCAVAESGDVRLEAGNVCSGITDTVVKAIEKGEFDAIIMNYANADMVGHSGKLGAAIKAVETVDAGLARIYQALKPRGGVWMITADHGNAETMIDPATGGPHTYHTTNPVPFILVSDDDQVCLKTGRFAPRHRADNARRARQPRPVDMTGNDLRIIS